MKLFLCFSILYISKALCISDHYTNYYWRDYDGVVPDDAFPAGKDINGEDVYIGQVYHHGDGFRIAELRVRKPVNYGGTSEDELYNATSGVKILCTDESDKFQWAPISDATFYNGLNNFTGYLPVEKAIMSNEVSRVGRVMYNGSTKVGYTLQFYGTSMRLCFVDGGRRRCSLHYEILVFNSEDTN